MKAKPHPQLSKQEIEDALKAIASLSWQNLQEGQPWDAVSFETLPHEGVLYVFRQNSDDETPWVAFKLEYVDSADSISVLPDCEKYDAGGDCIDPPYQLEAQ